MTSEIPHEDVSNHDEKNADSARKNILEVTQKKSLSERISAQLASIDRQAPGITYLGLGFWEAWNTIAFSGAFWLHDTESSVRSENLVLVHLIACVITLLILAALSKRYPTLAAKNSFTLAGALVACAGSAFIVGGRVIMLSEWAYIAKGVFNSGCVLTGIGTTILFIRAAALFGSLPPHRALYTLCVSCLFASMVYFVLNSCPNEVAGIGFVVLPLFSAALFCLRFKNVRGESQALREAVPLPKAKFLTFIASIGLCSSAIELVRSYILVSIPPTYSVTSTTYAQVINVVVLLIIMAIILLARESRDSYAKLYSVAVGALVVLIVAISLITFDPTIVSSLAWIICSSYNTIVWAMLFYLVFQWKANAVPVVAYGNAALSFGTLAASIVAMAYEASHLSDTTMQIILTVVGIAVLVDVLFVFSEKQISSLLLPVEEHGASEIAGEGTIRQSGKWMQNCRRIAKENHLSERETEVMIGIARGHSAQEIAERNVLSIYTVRAHTRAVYAKLDVHSKKELVDFIAAHTSD